jgi:hypothetical protein
MLLLLAKLALRGNKACSPLQQKSCRDLVPSETATVMSGRYDCHAKMAIVWARVGGTDRRLRPKHGWR